MNTNIRHRKTLILLFTSLPLFHIVEASDPNSDFPNSNSNPSPYIGIIFLLFTALIIFVTIFFYYLRERCHNRRRDLMLRLAASSAFASVSHRNLEADQRGLDPALVKAFPELTYSDAKSKYVSVGVDCAVCLSTFEDHETLRLLPKCGHVFHPDCVGVWLASHTTCPCCRADLRSENEGSNDVVIEVRSA